MSGGGDNGGGGDDLEHRRTRDLSPYVAEPEPLELSDDDLLITVDDDVIDERSTSARHLDGVVVRQAMAAAARSAPINLRIAVLEAARFELERWRLDLVGADGTEGQLGRLAAEVDDLARTLARKIAALRADVGDRKECERVRASADVVDLGKRRAIAAVVAAGLALGGAAWAMIRSRDKDVAAATIERMQLEIRVRNNEQRIDRLENRRTP